MDISGLVFKRCLIQTGVMSLLYNFFDISQKVPEPIFFAAAPDIIADHIIEYLIIGYFDDQHHLIQIREICSDCADSVTIPIRKITYDALNLDARSIIMMHNHPSGDPRPSRCDIEQTREVARILHPLGVHIDDHLIVAGEQQFSFREAGLL
jgi:DNA repair protein RadC